MGGWEQKPPGTIAQDANNRFVSDVEKALWNAITPGNTSTLVGTYLQANGATSQFRMAVQDGSGRTEDYWNADGTTVNTYHVSGEPAFKIIRDPNSNILQINYAASGVAGAAITWVTLLNLISTTGNLGIGTASPNSKLHVVGLPAYSNNSAAIAGGLTAGAFYRTGADPDVVCVVH